MALKRIPIPVRVELENDDRTLALTWADGRRSAIPAYDLRIACPCAGCVDEMTGRRTLDPDRIAADVSIAGHERVGRYALQLRFSDGHGTGLFTYETLRTFGADSPVPEKD